MDSEELQFSGGEYFSKEIYHTQILLCPSFYQHFFFFFFLKSPCNNSSLLFFMKSSYKFYGARSQGTGINFQVYQGRVARFSKITKTKTKKYIGHPVKFEFQINDD